ncbi:MAG: Asp-tRNA(Asn)/Glu-tRNA(Gln) amidotransferase subunit GatB [Nanoarchaeota archaeon]|mgnify:FL=1
MKGLIGLEIHAYLTTPEKLFCRCVASRERGLTENTHICPICTGQPGAKPMAPNADAVEKAVQIGLLLGCTINERVHWMRKHYDWPDLPKGYQTTMSGAHATPLGENGAFSGITISSMHLEEDPASWDPKTGCVDYNRSGLALVEIVTAPEFNFAEEVTEWLHKLVHALAYLKVVDSNAGIKVDVNVNIPGKTERVEIKNITSIEAIGKAIEFELERQSREGSVRETRRYDEAKGKTVSMRSKEQEADYRFMPDPDLLAVMLDKNYVDALKKKLPELPEVKLATLVKKYKIDARNAEVLSKHLDTVEFFERVAENIDGKFAVPWVTVELLRVLNWNKTTLDTVDIKVEHFVALLKLVKEKKITELQAKQILNGFVPKSSMPRVEGKLDDAKELETVINEIIALNKESVERYRAGETNVLNFLMGKVMKATNRRADFVVAKKILEKLLK